MAFCLPKYAAEALRDRFLRGQLNPADLAKKTSAERRAILDFLGKENATRVNALFESKLLLQNQKRGMESWAKQVLGVKNPVYKDALAQIQRLDKALDKKGLDAFLQDLVEMRTGLKVNEAQLGKLMELSRKIEESKQNLPKRLQEAVETKSQSRASEYLRNETPKEFAQRIEYGWNMVRFKNLAESLHPKSKNVGLKEFAERPFTEFAGLLKTMKATWDNSFWFNQGIQTFFTPRFQGIWWKNMFKSWGDIKEGLKGNSPLDFVKAEIYSRPNAINGNYTQGRLAIGLRREEALPSSIPERVPVLGRLAKASNEAYTGASLRLRADIYDRIALRLERQGRDITDPAIVKDIGLLSNRMTGRGSLRQLESAGDLINNIFFSGRLLTSTVGTILHPVAGAGNLLRGRKPTLQQQLASKHLFEMAGAWYALQMMVEALFPGTTDVDPRSAHFGQWKLAEDRYLNVTGPFRPFVRAMSQMVPTMVDGEWGIWRKNRDGKWTRFNPFEEDGQAFAVRAPLDVAEDFIQAKASPMMAIVLDLMRGESFIGEPNTPERIIRSSTVPFSVDELAEGIENEDDFWDIVVFTTANFMGASGIDYSRDK